MVVELHISSQGIKIENSQEDKIIDRKLDEFVKDVSTSSSFVTTCDPNLLVKKEKQNTKDVFVIAPEETSEKLKLIAHADVPLEKLDTEIAKLENRSKLKTNNTDKIQKLNLRLKALRELQMIHEAASNHEIEITYNNYYQMHQFLFKDIHIANCNSRELFDILTQDDINSSPESVFIIRHDSHKARNIAIAFGVLAILALALFGSFATIMGVGSVFALNLGIIATAATSMPGMVHISIFAGSIAGLVATVISKVVNARKERKHNSDIEKSIQSGSVTGVVPKQSLWRRLFCCFNRRPNNYPSAQPAVYDSQTISSSSTQESKKKQKGATGCLSFLRRRQRSK